MQIIKSGKLYDTETAELIFKNTICGDLYLSKKHHWFFVEQNAYVTPITKRAVRKILEKHQPAALDVLKKYFHYREA